MEETNRFSIPRNENSDGLEKIPLTDDISRNLYLPGVDLPDPSLPILSSPPSYCEEEEEEKRPTSHPIDDPGCIRRLRSQTHSGNQC